MRAFPTGPADADGVTKPVEVEGPAQWLDYQLNDGATPPSGLQIMRNFENAAKKVGGTIEGQYPGWCKAYYDSEHMPRMGNNCTSYALTMKQEVSINELADKLTKDGFVSLYINFDTGKATIKPDSAQTLDDAGAALKVAADLKVEVAGHTDNVGSPDANMKLSQDRAQAVMAALVSRGVKADRLTAKGYGQTAPIADNRTEEGRAKNRRVELVKK